MAVNVEKKKTDKNVEPMGLRDLALIDCFNVTHDIPGPITTTKNFIQLINEVLSSPPALGTYSIIVDQGVSVPCEPNDTLASKQMANGDIIQLNHKVSGGKYFF
eukprot:TRINITY_DN7702_c0_g1_i1.p1 TRINITY_DN7702_c0_g1~~TRINITY_DN7702_c0_g1_i1.p1  ORF type:complete len:104 (-),score=48.87 TRINITY_DN7702_c0_g1_i1:82-393(-)